MNASDLPAPPPNSLTVRVGCALSYQAEEVSAILLKIQPRPAARHILIEEELRLSNGTSVERLLDQDGNLVVKAMLLPGLNEIRHNAILCIPDQADNTAHDLSAFSTDPYPVDVVRYLLPSRYCECDQLTSFAIRQFGDKRNGLLVAQAVCDWTHHHIAYRFGSGDATLSAVGAIERGYGVCRDFAHVMVALCRALELPARYVAGHMPLQGAPVEGSDIGIDFHAYVEVYIDGVWHTFDPRHNQPFTGRIKVAHAMDAVEAAVSTFFGRVVPMEFRVWSYTVDFFTARIDDPVCLPA